MRFLIVAALSIALLSATGQVASVSLSARSAQETSLRALYQQLIEGWNRGSGTDFAAVFGDDADLVGPGGFHIKGRERIASFHQMLFNGSFKGSTLVGAVTSIRFLSDDVALIHAVGGPSNRRGSIHTMVAVKRAGQWFLESFQITTT